MVGVGCAPTMRHLTGSGKGQATLDRRPRVRRGLTTLSRQVHLTSIPCNRTPPPEDAYGGTKKTAAKKTAAVRKTAAKKTTAKRAPARKTPAKRARLARHLHARSGHADRSPTRPPRRGRQQESHDHPTDWTPHRDKLKLFPPEGRAWRRRERETAHKSSAPAPRGPRHFHSSLRAKRSP